MDESQGASGETPTIGESIENSSSVMENVEHENLEKEVMEKSLSASETDAVEYSDKEENCNIPRKEVDEKDGIDKRPKDEASAMETSSKDKKDDTTPEEYGDDKYAKHLTYDEQGQAIYTDPETKYKYKWSDEKNEWIAADSSTETPTDNPYENEHYRWCSTTNQWIPKTKSTSSAESEKTETDFYKWNEDTKQWIPKVQSADVVCSDVDGVYTYRDKDGIDYFWDSEKNAWFPKIDDDFMARYQMNYGFIDNTQQSDELSKKNTLNDDDDNDDGDNDVDEPKIQPTGSGQLKRKAQPDPPQWFEISPEQNTKVYVSNLPLDITDEEFVEVMSKYGLIMRDPKTQKFKVKLYAESDGQLKGDGLCDYIKIESVELALNLLDGYELRGRKINVQRAKFQMRGEYNPALKPKKKKKDKEMILKMKERLFDWRPEKMRGERSKHERVVVLKNLFTPELFDKEVHLIIDYQKDLREECTKCGTVRKVVVYDRHPEGVAQITMSDPEEADTVVQMMNGRYFGKRKLTAENWDGKAKFKIGETDAEAQKRLNNWDNFLESDEQKREAAATNVPAASEPASIESISSQPPVDAAIQESTESKDESLESDDP